MRKHANVIAAAVMVALESRVLLAQPTLWTTVGPGGGGSYFGAAVNGNELWIASDMSGIYHSSNFGQNWQMLDFHNNGTSGGIMGGTASQVSFTSDPNILYIPNSNLGVAKSTDGGATWTKLSGWGSNGTAYWMFADQTSTQRLLVASATKLYLSTNGGTSFTNVYTSSSGNLFVAGALFDGNNIYVGTNKGLVVSTNGSTFSTAGQPTITAGNFMTSFTAAKEGSTTRLMTITSTTNPDPTSSVSARSYGGTIKLWRLDVGGTWTDLSSSIPSGTTARWAQMARNNISTVYVAGRDANQYPQVVKSTNGGSSFADTFFSSTSDGGGIANKNVNTSYHGLSGDFDWGWGGWPWTFVIDNDDANRLFFGNSGFLQVTGDGGANWRQADVNPADQNPAGAATPKHKAYRGGGADDTTTWDLTWTSPTSVVAGYTDTIGFRTTDDGVSWAAPTWYTTANNTDNNTVYHTELALDGKLYGATSTIHDMYYSLYLTDARVNNDGVPQNGRVVVSTDQGATWSLIHEFGKPVVWVQPDTVNPNKLYACVIDGIGSSDAGADGGIWVTTDLNLGSGAHWSKLANPPRTEGHPYYLRILNDHTLVATYSGRRAGPSGSETFTTSSGVFVSTDDGATWLDRSHANMVWYTKGITIDPTDATQNTWYVTVANGWNGTGNDKGDIYRTTNRGVSWTKMGLTAPGFISLSTNSVTINPATKEMYVTTDDSSAGAIGLLYAPDVTVAGFGAGNFSNLTSFPFSRPERVFVNPYNSSDIWVTTFGGGIKRGGVGPSGLSASAAGAGQINLTWADNSANEAGFEIDRATNSTFIANLVTTTAALNATSASITGLSGSTTYYFRVRAVSGAAKSANSSSANATTATATPTFTGDGNANAFYLRRNGGNVEVFNTATPTGSPIYSGVFAGLTSITFTTLGGDDQLIVDSSAGNPIPSGGVWYDGGTGNNTLSLNSRAAGTVKVTGGTIKLASAGEIDDLQVTAGQFDVANGSLVLHNNYASVMNLVKAGRNGGAWNGTGIVTSMTAAKSPSTLMTLGVAPAPSSTVKVAYVFSGDANLDGVINGDDFFQLDSHAGQSGGSIGYFEGDLNYSGNVDADDYWLIDSNYSKAPPPPAPSLPVFPAANGEIVTPPLSTSPDAPPSRDLLDELR